VLVTTETPRARRGPYRKGLERRREIVQAAADLFATSGYASTSMRELAQRVGLTQAGLLHHFASKEELLTEVLGLRQESLEAALDAIPDGDFAERMHEVARHGADNVGLTSLFVVLSAEASSPNHPAHAYFAEHYRRSTEDAAERLAQATTGGGALGPDDREAVAALALAVLDGLQLQQRYRPDLDVTAAADAFWRLLGLDPGANTNRV
jgi:AcrR family transcriptional regulator